MIIIILLPSVLDQEASLVPFISRSSERGYSEPPVWDPFTNAENTTTDELGE